MRTHCLKLNNEKTEVLLITAPSLVAHNITSLHTDDTVITSDSVRDLDNVLDSALNLEAHLQKILPSNLPHLQCTKIYHWGSSSCIGSDKCDIYIRLLQWFTDWTVTMSSKSCHITPILRNPRLHILRINLCKTLLNWNFRDLFNAQIM